MSSTHSRSLTLYVSFHFRITDNLLLTLSHNSSRVQLKGIRKSALIPTFSFLPHEDSLRSLEPHEIKLSLQKKTF